MFGYEVFSLFVWQEKVDLGVKYELERLFGI